MPRGLLRICESSICVEEETDVYGRLRPGIQPILEALRNLYEGNKIIVGRDKLDVVKGVIQKLRAFEKLLQDYPEWIGNVVMIQVTSPAHHYHQTLKKDEFYALLSVADLAVITPLRDWMNTTGMVLSRSTAHQSRGRVHHCCRAQQ
ncbi:glycosyltransferase family 20 protein [Laccaria amethystina LaAM-08-1]|uniref:Glycosyltransferase family 20 protein n=1 Tax=Laccaria amethystina LaAM-08-1 TaxID=1095629 RepID=A0A0C9X1B4_9AGAR|nr:glycosyltransferase family 20 protein [Laccaria amethystina LaAM-08-1]